MDSIPPTSRVVIGGIDIHKDLHVAAVIDSAGVMLGTEAFSTTRAGYRALTRWLRGFGDLRLVGIEGTGSYGAGDHPPPWRGRHRGGRGGPARP